MKSKRGENFLIPVLILNQWGKSSELYKDTSIDLTNGYEVILFSTLGKVDISFIAESKLVLVYDRNFISPN